MDGHSSPPAGAPPATIVERGLRWLVGRSIRACELLTIGIGVWLTVVLVANVFFRYALNDSLTWVDESSALLLACLTLSVAPIGFHENFHISVDILVDHVPRPARVGLAILVNVAVASFFVIAGYYGVLSSIAEIDIPLYSIPIMRGWVTFILPLASVVIVLVCIDNVVKVVRLGDLPPSDRALVK